MQRDNIATADLPGLLELSIMPTEVEAIVPQIACRERG